MHTCRKTCHKGQCEEEGGEEGKERERCKQLCTLKREYCDHNCSRPCHVGSPCPDTPCRAKVRRGCGEMFKCLLLVQYYLVLLHV